MIYGMYGRGKIKLAVRTAAIPGHIILGKEEQGRPQARLKQYSGLFVGLRKIVAMETGV
jgi:hypothetical protein